MHETSVPPAILSYVADPMCSWCYGFAPVLERVESDLPEEVELRWVMGGLAPDSDEPMPAETREYVQGAWRAVAARTGAELEWAFWERCTPRRSTWPACRAVLAAEALAAGAGPRMFRAIQRAYYREARNPSDASTLVELAGELDLDVESFAGELDSPRNRDRLAADLESARALGVSGFPTLVAERGARRLLVAHGHAEADRVLDSLRSALADLAVA